MSPCPRFYSFVNMSLLCLRFSSFIHMSLCPHDYMSTIPYILLSTRIILLTWVHVQNLFFFLFGEVLVTRIHVHVLLYQNREVCPHLDIHIHIFYIQVIYIIIKIYKIHIWKWMLKCGEKKLQFIVTTVFVLYIWKMRKNTKNKRLNE